MKKLGDFQLVQLLGHGTHAEVYQGVNLKTTQQVAIKVIEKDYANPSLFQYIKQEVYIMRGIRHPNTVNFREVLETQNRVYIVMEYCSGGDLGSYIQSRGRVDEFRARIWLHQALLALTTMQRYRVIHRDIKPANILLSTDTDAAVVKISDFGFARVMAEVGERMTFVGTPLYMSPELANNAVYDMKSDVWSLGVVAYEMMVGQVPFRATNILELRMLQQQSVVYPQTLSAVVKDFLQAALTVDPTKRPSMAQLLQHEFFRGLEAPGPVPPRAPVQPRMEASASQSEMLERETLELDFVRIELEETLNEKLFYFKKKKLAGLALAYGVLERLKILFGELEDIRSRFDAELIAANQDFTNLYQLTQRIVLFESHEYQVLASRLKVSIEPSAELKQQMGAALLQQVRKQAEKTKNKPGPARSVLRVIGIVMVLLPESEEVFQIQRVMATRVPNSAS